MKKDIILSLIVGEITAWFMLVVFKTIGFSNAYLIAMPIVIPVLWMIGIIIGKYLGRFYLVFYQIVKFVEIGFLNTTVDFGVLNGLIFLTSATQGILYSVFKAISFCVAVVNSYLLNKYWTFEAGGATVNKSVEFLKFMVVSVVGVVINVGIATLVVNFVNPMFGFDDLKWANIGAVTATALSLVWNFIGYKLIVFKEKTPSV